ncbi:hypothetical protein HYR54_07500 [Candidatus Acetothermia bacterium]|nr:hypothetical protein [Candidatus Acetothermia bacterium]
MAVEKRFFEDMEWAEQHHDELLRKYGIRWIAIYNKQVVADGPSISKVEEKARAKTGKKHIPVYFLESGSNIYAG